MFDLFRSRDKAVRYLLGGLLVMVALSMVITLIPGFGSNVGNAGDTVVAEIGKDKITVMQVQAIIQQMLQSKRIPAEMMSAYVPQLIDRMIMERAVAYEAERQGFLVTDDEVVTFMQLNSPNFFQNGVFQTAMVQQALAQEGKTLEELIDGVREQLYLKKLQSVGLEWGIVSDAQVREEVARRTEKATVQYIAFSPDKFKSQVKLTDADIENYFKANRTNYRVAEKRGYQLILIDEQKVAETLTVPDAQLRAAYAQQMDRFRTPERVHVRHILIMTQGKPDSEKAALKAKTEGLLKQLKSGADFAKLAEENSEDPQSKVKGGDVGWVVRGQMVKNFEDASFNTKVKELSGVITTEYGYHIVEVLEKQAPRVAPFEEVKAQLASEVQKSALYEKMQTLADQARAELTKAPTQGEQIANKLHLQFISVPKAGGGDPIPVIGASQEVDTAIGSIKQGEVTQIIQLPANRLVVGTCTEIFPGRLQDLDEVKDKVKDALTAEKAQVLATDKSKETAEQLKKNPAEFDKIAKSLGLEVKSPAEFGHQDAVEGIGAAVYLEDAFKLPSGSTFGPMMIQGRNIIAKVTGKTPPDMSTLERDRESIIVAIKAKQAEEKKELLYDSILAKLIKEGKVKRHADVIRRLAASRTS
ncbi:MAG: peptidyl-prolyl cis-trans isomerase [Bryobacteraceae bacterium]